MSDLRDQLRQCIRDAGRAQITVAADLCVSQKHLSALLTGKAPLTMEWAERIAGACGRRMVTCVVPDESDLRDQLTEALEGADAWAQLTPEDRERFAAAAMHVFEAKLLQTEVAATERADTLAGRLQQAVAEIERLTQRAEQAEQAERERDVAVAAADPFKIERVTSLVAASTRLVRTERDAERKNAEQAEAAVERARDAGKVHRIAHPSPVGGCPACHILAALDQPGPAVTGDDVRDATAPQDWTAEEGA